MDRFFQSCQDGHFPIHPFPFVLIIIIIIFLPELILIFSSSMLAFKIRFFNYFYDGFYDLLKYSLILMYHELHQI